MKNENKKVENIELSREVEEKWKARSFYDDERDVLCATLFPNEIAGGAVSANGSTGLIQIIPTIPEELESYESINSFRQKAPIINKNEKDSGR